MKYIYSFQDELNPNPLRVLYMAFFNASAVFRARMCEECGFSEPTFYRKMRELQLGNGRVRVADLSNAEKYKACQIAEIVSKNLVQEVEALVASMQAE
ncbi:hypothetical protein HF329_33365 [Chitinophaga oryzae]|uniref:Uncharacterized protein n=1 Tax=Chitinophaga oryzae TaxID=2725414 RepID=A0AAE6ZPJ4_9BACT|nr:hypothetical protein [Chitinophaga oryzae]QJB35938.1 hypothetical protein HF329_33365 [Chitinophaga oryzae]